MKTPLRYHLYAFGFYFVAAILMTFPLITMMNERMVGHPFGDTYEYTRHIWWINHALRTGQPLFFQPGLMYPQGLDAPLLWSIPLQSFPAWLLMFVLPLPGAFNLSALLTLALNGWAMWVLSRRLTAILYEPPRRQEHQGDNQLNSVLSTQHSVLSFHSSLFTCLVAGLVFMLYPAFQGQLAAGHTGLLVLWPVPLFVAALARICHTAQAGDLPGRPYKGFALRPGGSDFSSVLAAGVFFAVSLWGSVLILLYLLTPITGLLVLALLWWRRWRALLRVGLALVLGAALSAPFVLPVLREQVSQPAALREDGSVQYSASLLGIVSPSFYHPLYSGLEYPHRVLGVDPFEGASYAGLVAGLLALIGVIKARLARGWLLLAGLAWLFSLGPLLKLDDTPVSLRVAEYDTHISLPWALFENLPVLSIARTPARFNFTVGFAVAVMAGFGAAHVWAKLRPALRRPLLLGLMALIVFDYQFFWAIPTVPAAIPEPVIALGAREDVRAVFNVPWQHLLTDKDGMYLQTGHGLPMIAGHISRRTPLNPAVGFLLQRTLNPALLDAAGVDVIILHKEWADADGGLDELLRQHLGSPTYEDERLALFDVPPYAGAAAGFVASANMPDEITSDASLYFYAPQPGTVRLTGRMAAAASREARLYLDDAPLLGWTVQGEMGLNVPIEIDSAGYHTLTLAVDPPCPSGGDPTLRCASLRLTDVTLDEYAPLATS